jgi:tungstate transport system ATP-binding protein
MKPVSSILPLTLDKVTFEAGGKRLIKEISCLLGAGPRSVILGPNGAGKSLLLRLCHGLIDPTSGTVLWNGADGKDAALNQAMVFQRPVMLRRSVAANIDYALSLRGLPSDERRDRIDDVLARTGLRRFTDRSARRLSGGEQQKLALARAWALRPQVLFLDEPTASLAAIHASGTKIVMTTHDLGQARRIADDVLFLYRGRLFEHSPAGVFFEAPRSAEAASFIDGKLFWRYKRNAS